MNIGDAEHGMKREHEEKKKNGDGFGGVGEWGSWIRAQEYSATNYEAHDVISTHETWSCEI